MLAKAGPSGEPMAPPSIRSYIVLLQLKSINVVLAGSNSVKSILEMVGGTNLLVYEVSEQI